MAPDPFSFGLAIKSHWGGGSVEVVRGKIDHGALFPINPSLVGRVPGVITTAPKAKAHSKPS
jgi:hypothetical protein